MRRTARGLLAVLLLLPGLLVAALPEPEGPPPPVPSTLDPHPVALLAIEGPIGPATADYFVDALERAADSGHTLAVLQMDTPGGLDSAMRDIIKAILSSPIPVATYVAPSGARAASAGTYILYASHIAAMAPGTNVGAATPVSMGGGSNPLPNQDTDDNAPEKGDPSTPTAPHDRDAMREKVVNDAEAYLRGLARLRGRNAEWASTAVRSAASLTAEEALEKRVIDWVTADLRTLLDQIHGRSFELQGRTVTLATRGAVVTQMAPDWRQRFLQVIASPSVAYFLLLAGIYGLFFEFTNPGAIVPGVTGAICLLLAALALQMLPFSYAGLGLIVLGVVLMGMEAVVPSFGALGVGGVIAFVVGSIVLIDTQVPGYGIPLSLILSLGLMSSLGFLFVVWLLMRSRRREVVSGPEEMIGAEGTVVQTDEHTTLIRLHGELWHARSTAPVSPGQRVRVRTRTGLQLSVEPISAQGGPP